MSEFIRLRANGVDAFPDASTENTYRPNGTSVESALVNLESNVTTLGGVAGEAKTLAEQNSVKIATAEQEISDINSSLNNYNGYGTVIEVTNDNSYTVPDNGILFAKCNGGNQNYIYFTIDDTFPTELTLAGTTSSTSMTVPIFKGQVVSISEQYGMAKLYFIPFTKTSN